MRRHIIAPSILASDFTRLAEECRAVLDAGADWLHIDVMDGHFVPNITIGLPVLASLRKAFPNAFLDAHLMIANPDDFIEDFARAGADLICFHPETSYHPHRTIQRIKQAGKKAGLAINPGTSLELLDYLVEDLDLILIMSVNPGFGGQAFIPATLRKLEALKEMLIRRNLSIDVQVDGGITADNIRSVMEAGANVFVAGSAIFGSARYDETLAQMRAALG
jgi:ribulose-phosphate 3-epimerase